MARATKAQAESKARKQSSVWSRKGTANKAKLAAKMKTQLAASKAKKKTTKKKTTKKVAKKK